MQQTKTRKVTFWNNLPISGMGNMSSALNDTNVSINYTDLVTFFWRWHGTFSFKISTFFTYIYDRLRGVSHDPVGRTFPILAGFQDYHFWTKVRVYKVDEACGWWRCSSRFHASQLDLYLAWPGEHVPSTSGQAFLKGQCHQSRTAWKGIKLSTLGTKICPMHTGFPSWLLWIVEYTIL